MNFSIVKLENDDLTVGTWDLSKGFEVEHRALKRLVEKYKPEFEELGPIFFNEFQPENDSSCYNAVVTTRKKKEGRKVQEFRLNEMQYIYLGTLLTNSDKVRKFKRGLTKEFFRMRKILMSLTIQKQNAEWLQIRQEGKSNRREETDMIKKYIQYCIDSGSDPKNAGKYYMNITKFQNKQLFGEEFLKRGYDNVRDAVSTQSLAFLKISDTIVEHSLQKYLDQGIEYHEIFQLTKQDHEKLMDLIGKEKLKTIVDEEKCNTLELKK